MVVDGIDLGIVGPVQIALELKIIGRVGENEIDAGFREGIHHLDGVTGKDLVQRQVGHRYASLFGHLSASVPGTFVLVVEAKDESKAIRGQILF
ncbi:hypothetical protein STA1M1_01860 [Sinisalibacter aestuarii]|uniref:Uncharacterized protein n=1 Tax=Sinisalibacter aestuarii TaxID=2949426 RepID=A0ABQ5LQH6_9RHOB|nr:hypothetical protein STA1M1_01860 [Sinisalibacter aestuarii]